MLMFLFKQFLEIPGVKKVINEENHNCACRSPQCPCGQKRKRQIFQPTGSFDKLQKLTDEVKSRKNFKPKTPIFQPSTPR